MRIMSYLFLLVSLPALALNETMLNMPANKAYMNFVLKRYLSWHRENLKFPEDSPLLRSLTGELDHWLVEGTLNYQITITHGVDDSKKYFQKIRVFIAPKLRHHKELLGAGLPQGKGPWFYEKDDSGKVCLLFKESEMIFSAWCRKTPREKFVAEWTEETTDKIPENWQFPFPFMGEKYIKKTDKDGVKEISYFKVGPHPSRMPPELYRPVYLNTKDALFPLDRVSTSRGGGMSVHYP